MNTETLACRGLACPNPILKTKQLIDLGDVEHLTVIVDNEAAKENVSRFLVRSGYQVQTEQSGGDFMVIGSRLQEATCEIFIPKPGEEAEQKTLVMVRPDRIWTNSGAKPGDALILTKPLGSGILTTALKAGALSKGAEAQAIEVMATLNKRAAEAISSHPVHGCTDITGFGLLGHALEMAQASLVTLAIEVRKVPVMVEVLDFAGMGLVPAGSHANRKFCESSVKNMSGMDHLSSPFSLTVAPSQRLHQALERLQLSVQGRHGGKLQTVMPPVRRIWGSIPGSP